MKVRINSLPMVVEAQEVKPVVVMPKNRSELEEVNSDIAELEEKLRDVATPDQMKKWILDICNANDLHRTSEGEYWESPNWTARFNGFKEVSHMLGYSGPRAVVKDFKQGNTQILIQVVDNRPEEEQKEIPAK